MTKLTICSPELGLSPDSNLGGEVYDREVINELCNQGIRVVVILPKNKVFKPHKNLKVYYLPASFVWPPFMFNFLIIPYLFWLYKKEKFDILRIHSPYFAGLGGLFFKLFVKNIPLVVTYHHLEENKPLFDLINRIFITSWDTIIADSKFTKNTLIKKYYVNEKKVNIVYAGVEVKYKAGSRKEELIRKYDLKNKKLLLFLGGLKSRKNIGFILKVIKSLNYLDVKLMICGSGPLYQKLKELRDKMMLGEQVILTGYVSEKNKLDYYNLADIFLMPSETEGFGLAVLEAARCGIPAIVSDNSSLKEVVVDGQTGYCVQLNNLKDWKIKINKLLSDNSLRKRMGEATWQFSQQFSWQRCAKQQIDIYKKYLIIRSSA
jgi:glycosyltransferase involved in cell wall biosynthesis